VFEKAKDNVVLREECVENGTLEKFIERVGALTGERRDVKNQTEEIQKIPPMKVQKNEQDPKD